MSDSVIGILFVLWLLSAMNVIDIRVDIRQHIEGEKVECVNQAAVANGQ